MLMALFAISIFALAVFWPNHVAKTDSGLTEKGYNGAVGAALGAIYMSLLSSAVLVVTLLLNKLPQSHFLFGCILIIAVLPCSALNLLLSPDSGTAWFYFAMIILILMSGWTGIIFAR